MRFALLLLAAFALAGCSAKACPSCADCPREASSGLHAAVAKPCPIDAGGALGVPATCETSCAHLADLKCAAAKPTTEGHSCVEVCRNLVDTGLVKVNLECRSTAKTCAAIDECESLK